MKRVDGKVAIVTGGAGALGSATAMRLAQEGARVVVADLNMPGAEWVAANIGPSALAVSFDAASDDSIAHLIEATIARYGRLDILNNNVADMGITGSGADGTVLDTSIETWDRAFAINIRSFFIITKLALPHLLADGGGSIVNIASGSALGGDSALVSYGSSKAAVIAFSKYVARQYGRSGVRCNVICPGPIRTPALEQFASETLRSTLRAVYVPDLGEPRHIAAAVTFLACEEAAYTNGAVLVCDGGLTAAITPWMADSWGKGEWEGVAK